MKLCNLLMSSLSFVLCSISFADECTPAGLLGHPDGVAAPGSPITVVTGDIDLDGDLDLVLAGSSRTVWFPNLGDGDFGPSVLLPESRASNSVAVGDVNGDGYPDIVSSHPSPGFGNEVSVLHNKGDGSFGASLSFESGGSPFGLKLADMNGDGRLDIVTLNVLDDSISVLLNVFHVTFAPGRVTDLGDGRFVDFALGDIDADGDMDVVVADDAGGRVRQFRNNGVGQLSPAQSVIVGNRTSGVQLGDLDGDGDLDLVATNDDDLTHDDVVVLQNNGIGVFSTAGFYRLSDDAGAGAFGVELGDLNGDDHLDIITANFLGGDISVLINDGEGSFEDARSSGSGAQRVRSTALGDLNGNGAVDIAAATQNSGTVSIWYNQCVPGGCPADLDLDGILDFFDVSAFLDAFAAQDPIADFTEDGIYDFFDVSDFLDAFGAGCP